MKDIPPAGSREGSSAATTLPSVGNEVTLYVCADCGGVEAFQPQAGCCPRCGSTRGDLARAVARIERYIAGDYWTRDA